MRKGNINLKVREARTRSADDKENQEITELNLAKKNNNRMMMTISLLLEITKQEQRKPRTTMIQAAMKKTIPEDEVDSEVQEFNVVVKEAEEVFSKTLPKEQIDLYLKIAQI